MVKRIDALLTRLVCGLPRQIIGKEFFPNHLMERYHLAHFEWLEGWPFLRVIIPKDPDDKRRPKLVLHRFLRGDNRRKGIHTHPWWCASVVILGGYVERVLVPHHLRYPSGESVTGYNGESFTRVRGWLSFQLNKVTHAHIVPSLVNDEPCWTLALIGPWEQEWGFPDVGQVVRDARGQPVNKNDVHTRCIPDAGERRCAVCRRPREAWLA